MDKTTILKPATQLCRGFWVNNYIISRIFRLQDTPWG